MDPVDAPAELITLVGAADTWIGAGGRRGDRWWHTDTHRILEHGPSSHLGVDPDPVGSWPVGDGRRWVVTARPDGASAATPEHHVRPDALPERLGHTMRELHERPLPADPVDALDELRSDLDRRLAADLIEPAGLPEPYRRHPADRLCALVFEGLVERIGGADPVLLHGDPVVDRFWATHDGAVTVVDGRSDLVGDRHLDLAAAHRSIHDVFGPAAVFQFYDAYGLDPDLVLLDRGTLASLLR